MRCAKCDADNREGRKFCASCGSHLALACPKCGAPNVAGEQFCGECGSVLKLSPAAQVSQQPPAAQSPDLTGERRHLTILFCDLVGSTTLTAQLDPRSGARRCRNISRPHRTRSVVTAAQSTAFYPVAELIRQLTDSGSAVDPTAQLESALTAMGLNPAEAIPLLAPLLNLPPSPEYPVSEMAAEQQRRRLLATLVEWLLRAARDRPLIAVIEDLHWVDPSTLELIQLLVEQGATAPLLLLYTARPEFRPQWPPHAHHLQLTLDRLSSRDVRTIVGAVAANRALADETISTLVERTGGVPLFVEELTRAVLESGDESELMRSRPRFTTRWWHAWIA